MANEMAMKQPVRPIPALQWTITGPYEVDFPSLLFKDFWNGISISFSLFNLLSWKISSVCQYSNNLNIKTYVSKIYPTFLDFCRHGDYAVSILWRLMIGPGVIPIMKNISTLTLILESNSFIRFLKVYNFILSSFAQLPRRTSTNKSLTL